MFVGAAVLANNLMIVAALLTKRSARRRKAPGKQSDRRRTGINPPHPHHVASHNLAWRMPIHVENHATKNRKIQQHNADLSPVHQRR